MAAGTMATAAGAALMLFYVLSRWLSRKTEEDNKDHGGGDDMSKSSRSVRRRRLSRQPAQALVTLLESIGTKTFRFTYSETFEKWAIGDLASGINYFMRKKWLPVKDLLRFKCVSKGWNQLVSDSILRHGSFPGLRFCKGDDNEDEEAVAI
ncbi:hypothetical protein LR48_Vigan02g025900 [Vigna angularis]|uniref:F-box domain-containing protein n=1 Tax=Phaseolus angularis TaxID=3914 RepID=A0A0L9TVA3_PHAAN|nr:hypothetical protein LR48_Vigan02g025900 [Vigna angularis]